MWLRDDVIINDDDDDDKRILGKMKCVCLFTSGRIHCHYHHQLWPNAHNESTFKPLNGQHKTLESVSLTTYST